MVAYHWPCPDGAFAALAALLALPPATTVTVPLAIFWTHAERLARLRAALAPGDTLYLVDFSGGEPLLRAACAIAEYVYLELVTLPEGERVDVIISEPMGFMLLHEQMLIVRRAARGGVDVGRARARGNSERAPATASAPRPLRSRT